MGVEEDLDKLRADFPGCAVVAYADLETKIVLVSSSDGAVRRDALDGLCAGAVALFSAAERAGETSADTVLRSQAGRIEVSLRDPERTDDALCAIFAPGSDLDGYLDRARDLLRAFGQDGGA